LPLYLYGGVATLGIVSNLFFNKKQSAVKKLTSTLKSLLWAMVIGGLIYLLCRVCKPLYGYGILLASSLVLAANMFLLLLQQTATTAAVEK
jgi:hypothetical protein